MTPFMMLLFLQLASINSGTVATPVAMTAALSLPLYSDYIAKTQITRIVGELASATALIDAGLFEDKKPVLTINCDENTEECMGYLDNEGNPRSSLMSKIEFVGNIQTGGDGAIVATAGNKSMKGITGVVVAQYRYADSGVWKCLIDPKNASGWKAKFAPAGCEIKSSANW